MNHPRYYCFRWLQTLLRLDLALARLDQPPRVGSLPAAKNRAQEEDSRARGSSRDSGAPEGSEGAGWGLCVEKASNNKQKHRYWTGSDQNQSSTSHTWGPGNGAASGRHPWQTAADGSSSQAAVLTWETWMESQVHGFGPAPSWPWEALGEREP